MGDTYRDAATGRKVKSLLGELGRLHWGDDPTHLIASYRNLHALPLVEVNRIIREAK